MPWLRAHLAPNGIKLESVKLAGSYLKIDKDGATLTGDGGGGQWCIMELVNLGGGKVAIRGHGYDGRNPTGHSTGFAGFTPTGSTLAPRNVALSLDIGFTIERK